MRYWEIVEENRKLKAENEELRRIFLLARREFEKKNERIANLEEELESAKEKIAELEKKLAEVEGKNKMLSKVVYSKKSEKKEEKTSGLKGEKTRGAREGHKGHGRKHPKNLPVREEIIELAFEERKCPKCGKPYSEMGSSEESEEVGIEKEYYIKVIKRKKYKRTCSCGSPIITAPVPAKIIPKGRFSVELWVDILINKFQNHQPIERQIKEMAEYGLKISSGTISKGLLKIHEMYIKALYEGMIKSLRAASHYHADETGWKLFSGEKANNNFFMWVFISSKIAIFVLHQTRSAKVPLKTLFEIEPSELKAIDSEIIEAGKKRMSVDKYSGYKLLEKIGLVELFFCWAHQRREFINVQTKCPSLSEWTDEWIERIGMLYHINNERIKYKAEEKGFQENDGKLREKIKEMAELINLEYENEYQKKIMKSMKENWKGLTLFVDNPEIPMDNNIAERTLRLLVLGRKNYWGNHSFVMGEFSAAIFSIIQTCLMHNISPRKFLTYYFNECLKRKSIPDENEIMAFLPHNLPNDVVETLKFL